MISTHVSAKPERYLSATLRILLWVWLKFTNKNWAWRSNSSSCSLVFAWKHKKQNDFLKSELIKFCKLHIFYYLNAPYLLSHHLKENIKYLVANTNDALHHACKKGKLRKWAPYIKKTTGWLNWFGHKALTRFVFLDCFVFKVSKHDLEPIRIIGPQHPERDNRRKLHFCTFWPHLSNQRWEKTRKLSSCQ